MILKACPVCVTLFETEVARQIYCGDKCRHKVENERRREKKKVWERANYPLTRKTRVASSLRWQHKNREHMRQYKRRSRLWETYRITPEQVDAMFEAQSGLCALCGELLPQRYHIDHDHVTGKIRGLLHDQCNRGLSLFGDNLERVEKAVKYLREKS
jgi:hypothetical protein